MRNISFCGSEDFDFGGGETESGLAPFWLSLDLRVEVFRDLEKGV